MSMYADRPRTSSTRPMTGSRWTGRCPSSTSIVTVSPGVTPSTSARSRESTRPVGGTLTAGPRRSTMRRSLASGKTPVIAMLRWRCPARMRAGTTRCGSTARTPGRRASACRASADRGSTNETETSCRSATENWVGDQFIHGVDEDKADDENSRREADADDGRGRAERDGARCCATPSDRRCPGGAQASGVSNRLR